MLKFKKIVLPRSQFFSPTNEDYDQEKVFRGTKQLIPWNSEGDRLEYFTINRSAPKGNLLFFGPSGGNFSLAIPTLTQISKKTNVTIHGFNYPGYGISEGLAEPMEILDSACWALNTFLKKADGNKPKILFGYSLGCCALLRALARTKSCGSVALSILAAPFSTPGAVLKHCTKRLPQLIRPFIELQLPPDLGDLLEWDNLAYSAKNSSPTLILAGDQDDFIPMELSRHVFNAQPGMDKQWAVILGAGHDNLLDSSELIEKVSNRIIKNIKLNAAPYLSGQNNVSPVLCP